MAAAKGWSGLRAWMLAIMHDERALLWSESSGSGEYRIRAGLS
jgi:hypothetical protein